MGVHNSWLFWKKFVTVAESKHPFFGGSFLFGCQFLCADYPSIAGILCQDRRMQGCATLLLATWKCLEQGVDRSENVLVTVNILKGKSDNCYAYVPFVADGTCLHFCIWALVSAPLKCKWGEGKSEWEGQLAKKVTKYSGKNKERGENCWWLLFTLLL